MANAETEYGAFVGALFKMLETPQASLMHAAVGVAGEAGELLDACKKHWIYNKPLDRANIVEELGDIEFYAQALRDQLGITRQEVLIANVEKLQKRYPDGRYTDLHAALRLDKA